MERQIFFVVVLCPTQFACIGIQALFFKVLIQIREGSASEVHFRYHFFRQYETIFITVQFLLSTLQNLINITILHLHVITTTQAIELMLILFNSSKSVSGGHPTWRGSLSYQLVKHTSSGSVSGKPLAWRGQLLRQLVFTHAFQNLVVSGVSGQLPACRGW